MEFSVAVFFFSGRDEPQSVENVHNASVMRVVEFSLPSRPRQIVLGNF